jgi:glycosyltransferase involved in cell wall biosynthesis
MDTRYILLTAAKNEEKYIGFALESVVRQTIVPIKWIIVDDGSTDRTAEVVRKFAAKYPFISLESNRRDSGKRSFGAKDEAINGAYRRIQHLESGFLGIQDADIAPERPEYYEALLRKFQQHPKLGIAGGYICEQANGVWKPRKSNSVDSVAGGIQMFRRECFDQMSGYTPLEYGGEDWLAQLSARIAGWETAAFPDYRIYHYRPTSSAGGICRGAFRAGLMDASFGSHPMFEFIKCCRRIRHKPLVLGSLLRFCGFLWWKVAQPGPLLSAEAAAFLRKEQLDKLRSNKFFCSIGYRR